MAIIQQKNKKRWTKDGRCWYFDTYFIDLDGKKQEKRSKYYKTKKEAQEAEREFLINNDNNKTTDNKNVTFEKVYLEWLNMKKSKVKITSFYRLTKTLNKNILYFFKDYKIKDINYSTVEKWQKKFTANELSVEYKNTIVSYLKDILSYVVKFYNLNDKIIDKLYTYRDDKPKKESNSKENFWTYDEFNKFISVVDNKLYYLLFNFLYYTGVRFGEMIALNWNDINFENKTLSITKSLSNKVEDTTFIITGPKTENSIREIELDDDLIKLLKEHKNEEEKIYNFSNDMFVFGNITYISATTFRRYLKEYVEKANVKYITPHGFRHSHVSLLIHLGCDSRDVAKRIGDTINVVESTYYHMFPNKKKDTVNVLNNFKKTR